MSIPEVMTPLKRKAAFKAAATLQEVTLGKAAKELGVSYNHLMLVLAEERNGSPELKARIAAFLGEPVDSVFRRSSPRMFLGRRPNPSVTAALAAN